MKTIPTLDVPMLDGPRILPAAGAAPDRLVILLHGYGSNGADLISLVPYWQAAMPTAAFVAPDAPTVCPGSPGFQWWPLASLSLPALAAGALSAAPAIDAFIDAELRRHGLTDDRLLLVGFSQGTMMALHVGPRRASAIGGIIGFSGMLADAGTLQGEIRSKPPILLVHGDADPIVPVQAMRMSAQALEALGFAVETYVSRGLAHSVDGAGLSLGAAFAQRILG